MDRERYIELIDKIIEEYFQTPEKERSLTKLYKKYGIKRQTLAKYIKAKGLPINYTNIVKIDQTMFDVIDTEEKAYWLGFMYADGNIAKNEDKIEMNLSVGDLDHMNKFKKFLKSEAKTRLCDNHGSIICRFSVRNKHMWQALYDKGCVPAKSLILKFPPENIFKHRNLIYDFIRGYCDGDGSLGIYFGKHGRKFQLSFCGTEEFLKGVEQFLGITGHIRNNSCNAYLSKASTLYYNSRKARAVSRLLYSNSTIYLDRKYDIYKMFCLAEEGSSVLKSSKIGRGWNANTEVTK